VPTCSVFAGPGHIYYLKSVTIVLGNMMGTIGLVKNKPKQAFRLNQNTFIKLLWNLNTNGLTDLLMPHDN